MGKLRKLFDDPRESGSLSPHSWGVAGAAAPIRAERDAWLKSSGVAARADRGRNQMTEEERAKMSTFSARVAALRVNMDTVRRVHPRPRRDSVFNGADDDASGVIAVIEIARRLAAGPRPKRTIIFMATSMSLAYLSSAGDREMRDYEKTQQNR